MTATIESIHNWRSIDERLATSGQPAEAQLGPIATEGYQTTINLALHDDPRYSLADGRATVEGLGMGYVHVSVRFDSLKPQDLEQSFTAMAANVGRKVWVHCAANLRASVFLGLYWIKRHARAPDDAFSLMRTLWTPNTTWSAFIERCRSS